MQRKEKLLKKQHRQALLLDNFLGVDGIAPGRSLRDRKPVTYTFGKKFYHRLHFVSQLELASSFSSFFFFSLHGLLEYIRQVTIFAVDCCGYVRALGTFWGK